MGTAKIYFNVRNQTISRTDRMRVVAMSHNYLVAHFDFLTDDWADVTKLAIFVKDGKTFHMTLDRNGETFVPWELLETTGSIEVSIYGGDRITTNSTTIVVSETGYTEGSEEEQEHTRDAITYLVDKVDGIESTLGTMQEELIDIANHVDGGTFADWHEDTDNGGEG